MPELKKVSRHNENELNDIADDLETLIDRVHAVANNMRITGQDHLANRLMDQSGNIERVSMEIQSIARD